MAVGIRNDLFRHPVDHCSDRPVMLFGEHLRGGHEHGLVPGPDRLQHGGERHHRFAGADLALQETLHRMVAGHVGSD